MTHRIRGAKIISTTDGVETGVFVIDETETHYEVLMIEDSFTLLNFSKETMSDGGRHLLHIPKEGS